MELKLAKIEPEDKPKTITLDEVIKAVNNNGSATFYLDKDNSLKDLQKMRQTLEKDSKSVHLNELKYGLDSHLYELHIININC